MTIVHGIRGKNDTDHGRRMAGERVMDLRMPCIIRKNVHPKVKTFGSPSDSKLLVSIR